ncbi:MAG: hypothetical protein ABI716_02325 [Candidatus Saccharibacteria bacterium]
MMTKNKSPKKQTRLTAVLSSATRLFKRARTSNRQYLQRRPHRSFRRTRRRDYVRSLQLPGYWSFTLEVRRVLWQNRKLFLLLALVYAILTAVMVGTASQDTYTTLSDTLRQTGGEVFKGNLAEIGQAGLLFVTVATGGLSQTLSEGQQIYAGLIALLTWLTVVWLLRNILAGHKVKLRDGLYNASAPLLSTFVVVLVLIVQLLPLALALLGYSAASTSGLLSSGVEAMLFWVVAGMLGLLSLYFITSTFIALIIVTLPGIYPFQALKTAGDMVVGRRSRILLRLVWMAVVAMVTWLLILIPFILLDAWIKAVWPVLQAVPLIPFILLCLSSLTIVWSASYIYLLYRKVVADDAEPA